MRSAVTKQHLSSRPGMLADLGSGPDEQGSPSGNTLPQHLWLESQPNTRATSRSAQVADDGKIFENSAQA